MKKLSIILFLFASSMVYFNSCEAAAECSESTTVCGTFEACCTTTDCWYNYNGKRYDCDGTDCTAAATELADVMCNKKSTEEFNAVVEELLDAMPCNDE